MPRLTEPEFKATMDPQPAAVDPEEAPPFDFWPYFELISDSDFEGHDFTDGAVTNAWTMPSPGYQHVLIRCETPNVFLVIVLDLRQRQVHGHYLLDLNHLYGLA